MTLSTGEPTIPVDALWLAQAAHSRESALLEHKQQWYDLNTNPGKAVFIKDILAMANTVRPDTDGHIIIGVTDKGAGNVVWGIEAPPADESIQQVLKTYTSPVPAIEHTVGEIEGKTLSVITVRWTASQPYYAVRDLANIPLSTNVYVRYGPIPCHDACTQGPPAWVGRRTFHARRVSGGGSGSP